MTGALKNKHPSQRNRGLAPEFSLSQKLDDDIPCCDIHYEVPLLQNDPGIFDDLPVSEHCQLLSVMLCLNNVCCIQQTDVASPAHTPLHDRLTVGRISFRLLLSSNNEFLFNLGILRRYIGILVICADTNVEDSY